MASPRRASMASALDARHLPPAEEERDGDGGDDPEVAPLGEEEEGEAEARVLGEVARHQLRLGLGQVEGGAVRFGELAREEDEQGQRRRRVPEGEPLPGEAALGADDALQGECAGHEHRHEDGEAGRDLVGDHLRRRAEAAEERPLGVGGPAGEQDADHRERGDRHHVEDAGVEVGGGDGVAEGQDHEGEREAAEHEVGRRAEEDRVGLGRHEVLLEEQLHRVGNPHEEAAEAGAVRADAALDAAGHPPLPPGDDAREGGAEAHREEREHEERQDVVPGPAGQRLHPEPLAQHGVEHGRAQQRGEEEQAAEERAGDAHRGGQGDGHELAGRELGQAPQGAPRGGGHRSISGATTSSEAMSATRSAIIRPGDRSSTMPMAMKLPVRACSRYALSLPSDTT